MRLPIGISDYKTLIEEGYYYVDKTLLVKDIVEFGGGATLICRPRRFGKTLNLSMLRYFFEKTDTNYLHLFTDKAIWAEEKYREFHGKFPVVFLTFKDIKETTWLAAREKIVAYIAKEYKRHRPFINANVDCIDRDDFVIFQNIAEGTASDSDLGNGLYFLSMLLYNITKQRVVILLDEYDAPIHAAYHHHYYDEMINFMRGFLSAGLKDNANLSRAVLTGILRTARESIFSGLNNLNVCTMLQNLFADKFGFLSEEVDALLKNQNMSISSDSIKEWYNGYHAGDATLLYNPWSIVECAKNNGKLQLYWVNTSDNNLIKNVLARANKEIKKELEILLVGEPLKKEINEGFVFSDIERDPEALWSLLLFSGYVTYSDLSINKYGQNVCSLTIPNNEIRSLYTILLQSIFKESLANTTITSMLVALQKGDVERFSNILQEFVLTSMSYYDFSEAEPEKSYHLFILGILVFLNDSYHIRSNRESGYGRYDLMLIPKDTNLSGIIFEFKRADSDKSRDLEKSVQYALDQAHQRSYVQELHAQGIDHVLIYAIAFHGKKLLMKLERK